MGYWIRSEGTPTARSLRILLIVAAVIAGLIGMHVLAGHGTPAVAGQHSSHGLPSAPVAAPVAAADHGAATVGSGHGCADCAEHAAMASACVLAPAAPAAVPGPPAEDLRPAPAAPVVASAANDPADPRPPSISVLCISRR